MKRKVPEVIYAVQYGNEQLKFFHTNLLKFRREVHFRIHQILGYWILPAGQAKQIVKNARNHKSLTRSSKRSVRGSSTDVCMAVAESMWSVYQPRLCKILGAKELDSGTNNIHRVGLVDRFLCPVKVGRFLFQLGVHPAAIFSVKEELEDIHKVVSYPLETFVVGNDAFLTSLKKVKIPNYLKLSFLRPTEDMLQLYTPINQISAKATTIKAIETEF